MNLADYQEQVGRIPYGKLLPTALYVHRDGLAPVGGSLGKLLAQIVARYQVTAQFNLVKFRTDELKLSFLAYPEFESDPHPTLKHAVTIDLATGKARRTDYTGNANPPILHRKETFLPAGHPLLAQFEALTRAEELAGLYASPATIGFKLNWEKLLQSKGLAIIGHNLMHRSQVEQPPPKPVPEGRPAIAQRFNVGTADPLTKGSPEGAAETVDAPTPNPPGQPFVVARHKTLGLGGLPAGRWGALYEHLLAAPRHTETTSRKPRSWLN